MIGKSNWNENFMIFLIVEFIWGAIGGFVGYYIFGQMDIPSQIAVLLSFVLGLLVPIVIYLELTDLFGMG